MTYLKIESNGNFWKQWKINFIQFWPQWLIFPCYKFILMVHYDFKTLYSIQNFFFVYPLIVLWVRQSHLYWIIGPFFIIDNITVTILGIAEYLMFNGNRFTAYRNIFTIRCHCLLNCSFVVLHEKRSNFWNYQKKVSTWWDLWCWKIQLFLSFK